MDAQEYINNQFNERLEKLETKVDSMENKINELKLTNAKQTVILEKIENIMDKISKLYDEIDETEENDLKYMFRNLTEILLEYEEL